MRIKVLIHSVQPISVKGYGNRLTGYGVLKDQPEVSVVIVLTETEGDTTMLNLRSHGMPVELVVHDTQIVGIEVPPVLATA